MSNSPQHNYAIFSVVDENERRVYVDKSFAKSLQPTIRRFVQGSAPMAESAFGSKPSPQLYLIEVESLHCDPTTANVHVLAWSKRLEEWGFCVSHPPVSFAALASNDTKRILESLQEYTLESVLSRPRLICKKATCKPRSAAQKHASKSEQTRFSFRLDREIASAHRAFCSIQGVTQGQGLGLLLAQAQKDIQTPVVNDLMERLKRADLQIAAQQDALNQLRTPRNTEAVSKHKEEAAEHAVLRGQMISEYWRVMRAGTPPSEFEKIKKLRFSKLEPSVWRDYRYPSGSGVMLFKLHQKAYGKTDGVMFLFGEMEDGTLVKFRTSRSQKEQLGISMWFADSYPDDEWLVAYRLADDGAVDLVDTLPIPPVVEVVASEDEDESDEEFFRKFDEQIYRSLNDQIDDAKQNRENQ